ncbi:MAG: flavin reductase family protein [Betaproteobacteria bacterium]|nr:flavin reductase family protein [Betaproteobacteria bacterium]MSQ89534.1 flavin reductase family protein [Betaproteobacteria bacterium]
MDLQLARLPVLERYKLLVGLVIPRPIGWVSTWNENGVANCAPFSFFNAISEEPPLCILSFNLRSDGAMKHTLKNIHRTGEYVVNLADEVTANAMHISSYEIPETESEFAKTGLTPVPATMVKHPRIGEAAASLECKVERCIEFGPERELVIGEILLIHAREGIIDPVSKRISEEHYHPIGRLFASRYCTTRERFDLPGELP